VISLVGTVSGKSMKLLPKDYVKLNCTEFDFGWTPDPLSKGAYFSGERARGKQ